MEHLKLEKEINNAAHRGARCPPNKAADELSILLDKFDWFYEVVVEGNSLCVYVTHMGPHTSVIPDIFYGYHVKEGFSAYLNCKDKYGGKPMFRSSMNDYDDYE